jgi:putative glutamine amidotransferase
VAKHADFIAHHAPDELGFAQFFDHTHPVSLTPGGILHKAYARDELDVISVHYQGADRLGAGLRVEAVAPDGVVEAVSAEVNGAPVLAVQWHPEWRAHEDADRQTFFRLMGRALRGEKLG